MAVKLNKSKETPVKEKTQKQAANDEPPVTNWDSDAIDFRLIDINLVESNDYNPNDMEAEFFEAIVKQVQDEGMNQPILVRENPDKQGFYLIVDGEHRWKACKIAGKTKIGVIVVQFDEAQAKIRTLSMNDLRGQNIPIKLARLLVDIHKTYSPQEIRAMTGIGEDEQISVLKLLEVPTFNPSDGIKISTTDVERPISVNIMLMPDEHAAYTTAMKKAMKLMGDDVIALIGHEVGDYDKAMKAVMGIAGAKLRNVAMAVICETFNALPTDYKEQIGKTIYAKIYDKLAQDAEVKETKKQQTDKKAA